MKIPFTRETLQLTVARNATLALVLAPWLFIAPQHEEKLRFTPREGSRVAKRIELAIETTITRFDLNGLDFLGYVSTPLRLMTSADFTDSYVELGSDQPLVFLRQFDVIKGTLQENGEPINISGFGALSGCRVRFTWEPEKKSYSRSMEEGKAGNLDLDALVEDLDLRGFLPDSPVELGARWTARGRPVMDALFGAAEVGWIAKPKDRYFDSAVYARLVDLFRQGGNKNLAIECVHYGVADAEHPNQARIGLQFEDKFQSEVAEQVNESLRSPDKSYEKLKFDAFDVTLSVDGRGTLIWNSSEGRFESLELEARIGMDFDCGFYAYYVDGGDSLMTARVHCDGTAKWTMSAKQAP